MKRPSPAIGQKEVVDRAALLKSNALSALDKRLLHLNRELAIQHKPNTIESWLYARKLDDIIMSAEQRADIESQNLDTALDGQVLLGEVLAAQILDPSVRKAQLALMQKLKDKPKARDALAKKYKAAWKTSSQGDIKSEELEKPQ